MNNSCACSLYARKHCAENLYFIPNKIGPQLTKLLIIIVGKVLCQGGSLEVDDGITLSLRQYYGQPLIIIELGIKFCLSMILSRKDPRGILC